MFPYILVGGYAFWILVGAFLFLMSISLIKESEAIASILAGILIIGLIVFTDLEPWKYVLSHPINSALYAIGYIVLGAVYMTYKWWRKLKKIKNLFQEHDAEFRKQNGLQPNQAIPSSKKNDYICAISNHIDVYTSAKNVKDIESFIPKASRHKSELIYYAAYWPIYLSLSALTNLTIELFNNIYNQLKDWYDKMAQSMFKDSGLKFEEEPAESNKKI